ncbi:MFS transporter [Streptomyces sp. KR80]|uniref:MFS transporter n=1 Tax=Streptomyces sp. KR80 TaxID=3457426 RepID=UPI003FCF249E
MTTVGPTRADDAGAESGAGGRISVPGRRRGDEGVETGHSSRGDDGGTAFANGSAGHERTGGATAIAAGAGRGGDAPHAAGRGVPLGAPPGRSLGEVAGEGPYLAGTSRAVLRGLAAHPVLVTLAVAAALHVLWFLVFANSGGDLAAQDAWAEFAGRHPDSAYNLAWYGGMHPVSYSVISPYLMHVLGVRLTMMIVGTVSSALLALILARTSHIKHALAPSLAGAFAFTCNAVSGRVTFGLGTMFALGAVAVVFSWPRDSAWRTRRRMYQRAAAAALLAGLATAGSPVAGLFLGIVAVALFLDKRRLAAYSLGVTPAIVVGVSALLFPFSGTQPMNFPTAVLPFLCGIAAALLVPGHWRTVRIASVVYAVGALLTWLIDSQVGSNVTRLALVFAGVVFLAALPRTVPRSRRWVALCLAFAVVTGWQTLKTVDDVLNTTPAASWARELAPLVDRLQRVDADRGRVEVIPARSHREASALESYVNLARGWNRQADRERNPLFYEEGLLTPAGYHAWLKRWAVRYVVVPKDELDGSGADEAELVEAGQPYLKKAWADANWKLYRVVDPTPMADPPATAERADEGEMIVTVPSAGSVLVRIPYSPWLGLVDSQGKGVEPPVVKETGDGFVNVNGCLTEQVQDVAEGEPEDAWTVLHAPRPGTYRIAAPYQLPRGTPCPELD